MGPRPSRRIQQVQSPIIPTIASLIRKNPGTISLGQGVVFYSPPLEARAAAQNIWEYKNNHLYQSVHGVPDLHEIITHKLINYNRIKVDKNQKIMVTAGGNMAYINSLLAIADPGDEIILITPYYFNHEMAITMIGARPVLVAAEPDGQIDPDRISQAITARTRAVTTVSPNNPSGAVYPKEVLEKINKLCESRGIFHIHDEAYEYFHYDHVEHFSPGSISGSSSHTISLFSLSKTYGFAGWRIGYMVYPSLLEEAMTKIQDTNLICAPTVTQHAAVAAMKQGESYIEPFISRIEQTRNLVVSELRAIEEYCSFSVPQGAFYIMINVHSDEKPLALATHLIESHGVALIPGDAFGLEDGCPLRIAYGAMDSSKIQEGIGRLVEGIRYFFEG